jgi:ubiquinone/menaquinone biosynthesis C-methylase UbiE
MVAAFRFDEWDTVLQNVMRVLKPGGYIQVLEPDIRVRNNMLLLDESTHYALSNSSNPSLSTVVIYRAP